MYYYNPIMRRGPYVVDIGTSIRSEPYIYSVAYYLALCNMLKAKLIYIT